MPQRPRRPGAVRVALRVGGRRARDPGVVQRPGDPGDAVPGQPLGEHPPHHRRGLRVRLQPVRPPAPRGVRLVRVRPGVGQPVPVRRPAAEVAALLAGLGGHRGPDPDPGPGDLPLGLTAPAPASSARDPRRGSRPARRPPASTAGRRSARTAAPSTRTGRRRTPARTPRSRSRPSPGPGRPAPPPARRPAGGAPTAASGSARRRRTPPRSARARPPAPRPGPAAAPATSPDPASPRSTPARRTRTAAPPARPAPPPGGPVRSAQAASTSGACTRIRTATRMGRRHRGDLACRSGGGIAVITHPSYRVCPRGNMHSRIHYDRAFVRVGPQLLLGRTDPGDRGAIRSRSPSTVLSSARVLMPSFTKTWRARQASRSRTPLLPGPE